MADKPNPYIEPENYYAPLNDSIKRLKENPEGMEFNKMCYEIFLKTFPGQELMKELKDRYFFSKLTNPGQPNYSLACIHVEGARDLIKVLINAANDHLKYINSEANNG